MRKPPTRRTLIAASAATVVALGAALPGAALARHGADDGPLHHVNDDRGVHQRGDDRREDRRADRRGDDDRRRDDRRGRGRHGGHDDGPNHT